MRLDNGSLHDVILVHLKFNLNEILSIILHSQYFARLKENDILKRRNLIILLISRVIYDFNII